MISSNRNHSVMTQSSYLAAFKRLRQSCSLAGAQEAVAGRANRAAFSS